MSLRSFDFLANLYLRSLFLDSFILEFHYAPLSLHYLSLCSLVLTFLCPCVPLSSHSFVFTLLFCFALLFFASLSLRSFFLVLLFPYAPLYLRSLVLTLLCPYAPLSLRSFVLTLLCPCASFP